MNKKWEIVNDSILIIVGISLLIILKVFYPIQFIDGVFLAVTGMLFAVIGIIGLLVDIRIAEKQREKAVWWQLNLPVVLGILFINSRLFYATFNLSGHYPSDSYHIVSISIGIALWILAFSYDILRKYRRYLKGKQNKKI
ncbi:hypothetical protein JOC34_003407 [Virgibacillus halotolerans]|uniref:hypothetical protein n=1 Tax=Virgibacillus halotolerans TaxID=1071053 RepID=UPI00195F91B9|nr:hypothetical protein [Virgibacillus halotolerans]MBM7600986.1 hypothetical protein [Virgibacillus halotolerans]